MHADTSRAGASSIAKRASDNPRELLISMIEQSGTKNKDALFELFGSYIFNSLQKIEGITC